MPAAALEKAVRKLSGQNGTTVRKSRAQKGFHGKNRGNFFTSI